jgi:hypothetical protein
MDMGGHFFVEKLLDRFSRPARSNDLPIIQAWDLPLIAGHWLNPRTLLNPDDAH